MKRILGKVNNYKKNNRKGFTLIEMIGVIVLIGLIMIAVLPSMSKLIHSNSTQEYENYYSLVEDATKVYAANLGDKLGSTKDVGCAMITLNDLIDGGYIQSYPEDDYVCVVDEGIRIRNNMGNVSVIFQLKCGKKGSDGKISKDKNGNFEYTYIYPRNPENPKEYANLPKSEVDEVELDKYSEFKLEFIGDPNHKDLAGRSDPIAAKECNSYIVTEKVPLKEKLSDDKNISSSDKKTDGNNVYIVGKNVNNYIWYSGKLWRAISYDDVKETVKVVSVDSITSLYYNHNNESLYSGSDVETWLNNDFLNSLKDYQEFTVTSDWNSTSNVSATNPPTDTSKVKRERVGLVDLYEFEKIKAWYSGDTSNNTWLLSEGVGGKSLYANASTSAKLETTSTSIRGVRPAIVLSSDVIVYGGAGSRNDPYIIDNSSNSYGQYSTYLNTRFSGEYVSINHELYRIVSTDGITTKVIGASKVSSELYQYSDNHFDYSASSIREKLEADPRFDSELIVKGDFCTDTINNSPALYQSSKCIVPERINNSIRIGLPKIGDFFTTGISGVSQYWTINPNTEIDSNGNHYNSTINIMKSTGDVSTSLISSNNLAVVVFYLDSETVITGGKGTINDPYTIILSKYAKTPRYLTYNLNGAGASGCSGEKMGFVDLPWDTLCVPTRSDYTFLGWYTDKNGGTKVDENTICKDNITVYAHWKPTHYTLTYDSNGGTSCGTAKIIPVDTAVGELCVPTKEKYIFLGWYTERDGGTQITATTVIDRDMKVYAHWTDVLYTLTYNSTGGSTCTENKKAAGQTWGSLCTPTRAGYIFAGWYTSDTGGTEITATSKVTGDLKAYAHWTPITYTIEFDPSGGTGTTASVRCTYGQDCKLTANGFTKKGYVFKNWINGSEIYLNNATVRNLTTVNNGTVTLRALWGNAAYKITFDKGSGTGGSMSSITCQYDENCTLPLLGFTKPSYLFLGWQYNGKTYENGATVRQLTTDSEAKLVAQWGNPVCRAFTWTTGSVADYKAYGTCTEPHTEGGCDMYGNNCGGDNCECNTYTIKFDSAGGSPCNDQIVVPGNQYKSLCSSTRVGYKFLGWYTKASGGSVVTSANVITGNITLYAQWTKEGLTQNCRLQVCEGLYGTDCDFVGSCSCAYGESECAPSGNTNGTCVCTYD